MRLAGDVINCGCRFQWTNDLNVGEDASMRKLLPVALLVGLLASLASAQSAKTPTIEQSLSMKNVSGPRISPDGRLVAYQVQKTNWEENAFETELWVAVVATGERYQLTNAKKSSAGPQWSFDSKRIAFVSDRDGKRQLYVISPSGGEAVQLTALETGVSSFAWSPDGRYIAYTAAEPESKERKERKDKYGEFEVVHGDYVMTHLWMIEVPTEAVTKKPEPVRLTDGAAFSVGQFNWSPDSTRIAFGAARNPDLISSDTSDIYVLTVGDKSVKKIVDTRGPDTNPVWSPDGRQVAFETADAHEFHFFENNRIAVVASEGGAPQVLTASFDEEPMLLAWSPDGIYFTGQQKTSSHLFRVNTATKAIDLVSQPVSFAS